MYVSSQLRSNHLTWGGCCIRIEMKEGLYKCCYQELELRSSSESSVRRNSRESPEDLLFRAWPPPQGSRPGGPFESPLLMLEQVYTQLGSV